MTALDSLAVGEVIAEREIRITRANLVRYAGASGDFNPIHYRDDIAASVGLPGVLAHGMLTMGVAGSVATDWLGALGDATWVKDYQAKFTRPVVVDPDAGAVLTIVATVAAIDLDERTARIDLRVVYDGKPVLGKAQLVAAFA